MWVRRRATEVTATKTTSPPARTPETGVGVDEGRLGVFVAVTSVARCIPRWSSSHPLHPAPKSHDHGQRLGHVLEGEAVGGDAGVAFEDGQVGIQVRANEDQLGEQ